MNSKHLITALALMAGGISTAMALPAAEPQTQGQAATVTATGTVLDEYGDPLIGASVIPEGQATGVATERRRQILYFRQAGHQAQDFIHWL